MNLLDLQPSQSDSDKSILENTWMRISDYVLRNYQCLVQNPGLFMVRKLGRIEVLRDLLSRIVSIFKSSYRVDSDAVSVFRDLNVDQIVESLEQEGYFAGINLPQPVLQEILSFAYTKPCLGDRNPNFAFVYPDKRNVELSLGKTFICASYKVKECAAITTLINDPTLLNLAAKFLRTNPVCIGVDLLWSFPTSKTLEQQLNMAQVFHYDLDDFRSIKFFFYLTDVDSSSGSHVCIRGSHRGKTFLHQILGQRCASIPDEKIIQTYGADNVIPFCGKAGFGFAEDPCCFHKGAPPATKERLLLQIQYASHKHDNLRSFKI